MFTCSHLALEESRHQAVDVAMQKMCLFIVAGLWSLMVSFKKNTSIESYVVMVMLELDQNLTRILKQKLKKKYILGI